MHNFINPFLLQRNTIAFCYLNLVLGMGGGKICAISRKNSFKSHRTVCLGCCKKCTNSPNFVNIFSFLRWHKRGKCCHQILWFFLGFTKFGEKSSELYFTKLCEAKYCDVFFTKFGEKLFTQFFSPKLSPIFFTKFGEKFYTPKIHRKNAFKNHKIWWKFGHKI